MVPMSEAKFGKLQSEDFDNGAVLDEISAALKRREKLERVVDVLIDDLDPDMNRHRIAEIRDNLIRLRNETQPQR